MSCVSCVRYIGTIRGSSKFSYSACRTPGPSLSSVTASVVSLECDFVTGHFGIFVPETSLRDDLIMDQRVSRYGWSRYGLSPYFDLHGGSSVLTSRWSYVGSDPFDIRVLRFGTLDGSPDSGRFGIPVLTGWGILGLETGSHRSFTLYLSSF